MITVPKYNIQKEDKYKSGIYKIVVEGGSSIYIGSAVKLYERFKKHIFNLRKGTHHCKHLQNAFKKYGEISFKFEPIEFCDKKNLINREQYWLDISDNLYNTSRTAGSTLGVKHSEETKKKLREIRKNYVTSEETKRKISEAGKGRIASEESKNKMSVSCLTSRKPSINKTGYPGISLDKRTNKWKVRVRFKKKTYFGGYFEDIKEAYLARLKLIDRIVNGNA